MDFSTIKSITIPEGNVKEISDGSGNVIWSSVVPPPPPILEECLGFSGDNPFTLKTSYNRKSWDGKLEWRNGETDWAEWNGEEIATGEYNAIYIRGTGNTKISGDNIMQYSWVFSKQYPDIPLSIECEGNIENLLDYHTVRKGEHPVMANYCYNYLFSECEFLITAPKLPSQILADSCYNHMFYRCIALIRIPALPATITKQSCYSNMFNRCTSLKFSTTRTVECPNAYRIPTTGTGTTAFNWNGDMINHTSGTFTGPPNINTTYYTNATIV